MPVLVRAASVTYDEHMEFQLGAYLLGALSADEDRRVSAHLCGCARCRAAYFDLADTPALLAMLSEEDLRDPPGHTGPADSR